MKSTIKHLIRRLQSFFLLFIVNISIAVASENITFRTFSPEGGFYYDGVKGICQDNKGFIWIIMDNNLYRFDGYDYKSYYYQFKKADKAARWIFTHLASDKSGTLLVNTNNGLFRYNRKDDTFIRIFEKEVNSPRIDSRENIWIRYMRQWHILNVQEEKLFSPLFDGEVSPGINDLFCTYNDDLYLFSSQKQMFRYNYPAQQFNLYMNLPLKSGQIQYAKILKGKLWIVDFQLEVYKFDLSTSQLEESFIIPAEKPAKKIFIDKNGIMWIGGINGLYTLDLNSRKLAHHQHSKAKDSFSIPNNSIWTIAEDFQENIWIGTFAGELCYVNLEENKAFRSFFPQDKALNHAPVSGFTEDKNNIWISTEGGGVNCMNKATGAFTYYRASDRKHSTSDNLKPPLIDKYKRLWISSFRGGIDCLDTSTGKVKSYRNIPGDSNSILYNDLRKLVFDGDSGLWIAYQHPELVVSHYSFRENRFTHYPFSASDEQYYIFDILRGRDNRLWLLSHQKLYMMNLIDHSVTALPLKDSLYLSGRAMCMDDSGNIWIGTTGNGLVRYEPDTQNYTIFNQILDYGINTIYSIIYDGEGNLWLGTDYGLFRYTIATKEFLVFDKEDGTQGRAYYPLSAMKSSTGELYFGGTNGFTIVNPKFISKNRYKPQIIISDFLIDYKSSEIQIEDKITLNYDQSNFGFRFSSDNYMIPEKTHFKYRLRGYDDRWISTNAANRTAFYSKIPAGTYYFEIMAANNDGVWNDIPTVITIKKNAAPWLSMPAYIIYLILILSACYLGWRYYRRQKELQLQIYHEQVEKEKKEEIHQSQLRFFTNISHDFRTPLTLIMGIVGKLKQEGVKEYYYGVLYNNAQRLLNLVNELMEFRTIENGKMSLHPEPFNVNALIQRIADDFREYASQRSISYNILCDKDLPTNIYVDRQIVEKIIMNLLNNAFKYTRDGGSISIESHPGKEFTSAYRNSYEVGDTTNEYDYFIIAVRDTGIGISKESIRNVFERFYKVDTINSSSHLGTGIGLALVKSLVLLHKGKISIHSERDKGSDFAVYLPLSPAAYGQTVFNLPADTTENSVTAQEKIIAGDENTFLRNKKRILIVEDNTDLRKLIADFLSAYYETVEAEDGVEAWELLVKMEINLVISDIMMPHKDGIVLSKEIRENMETSHIPVILLTAKTGIESKIEGTEAGADVYFEKPIDFNLLLATVNNIFEQRLKLKEYYAKNYFADSSELAANEHDNKFLKQFIEVLDNNLNHPELDVNFLAAEMLMSRSKLYLKIKALTDKSIIEFILSYRLRKAARIIIEEDIPMRQVMEKIGIESQSYFTNSFKKEFGETPSSFATRHKGKQ